MEKAGNLVFARKQKCPNEQITQNTEELKRRFGLPEARTPTHDELSALVAFWLMLP
jgi:hypothetical protein